MKICVIWRTCRSVAQHKNGRARNAEGQVDGQNLERRREKELHVAVHAQGKRSAVVDIRDPGPFLHTIVVECGGNQKQSDKQCHFVKPHIDRQQKHQHKRDVRGDLKVSALSCGRRLVLVHV